MPYIKCEERPSIDRILGCLDSFNEGQMNYIITKLCRKYIEENGESYVNYNALIGVLECAKLELYRRKISSYENLKVIENGDVY
jgi:hypothetical protein